MRFICSELDVCGGIEGGEFKFEEECVGEAEEFEGVAVEGGGQDSEDWVSGAEEENE